MSKPEWGIEIPGGWFHEESHIYRDTDGVIVPSATQVIEINGLSDFSLVNAEDLEWKRLYGDAVHDSVEFMVQGDLDWDTLEYTNPVIVAPVRGIEQRLKEMDFKLEAAEERRIITICGMKVGMTLDLRGTILHRGHRRHAVIDLKTGSKFAEYWKWQLGCYLHPQPKVQGGWMGIILQAAPTGKVTPHYVADTEAAKREFHALLATANLKINNGYATVGNGRVLNGSC